GCDDGPAFALLDDAVDPDRAPRGDRHAHLSLDAARLLGRRVGLLERAAARAARGGIDLIGAEPDVGIGRGLDGQSAAVDLERAAGDLGARAAVVPVDCPRAAGAEATELIDDERADRAARRGHHTRLEEALAGLGLARFGEELGA